MAELTMHDIERSGQVRAVTDNLFFWQGLRFIALGPVMMLIAYVTARPEMGESASTILLLTSLILGTVATHVLGKVYQAMGTVQSTPGAHVRRSRLKWFFVYPIMFTALGLDLAYPLPVLLTGVTWAAALIAYRRSTGGGRNHYLVLAAVLAAFTFAPMVADLDGPRMIGVLMLVLGAGFTVAAWLDDKEMRRVLQGV